MSLISRRIEFLAHYENYSQIIKLMNPIIEKTKIFNRNSELFKIKDEVFSMINYYETNYTEINDILNYFKSKDNKEKNSILNTYIYYIKESKKEGEELLKSSNFRSVNMNYDSYSRIRAVYYLMISSYMNFINYSYENISIDCINKKDRIAIFEALPIDQEFIDLNEEVENLEYIFQKEESSFFPIVRMATTYEIFKKTCNDYKPKIIHFCCHGKNNEICLLKRDGKTFLFNPDVFLRFFQNEKNGFSHEDDVKLVYINSCYSDTFAARIRKSKNSNICFYKTIGYSGKLYDDFAIEYSKELYCQIYKDRDFWLCLAKQKIKNQFDITKESKICLCKR